MVLLAIPVEELEAKAAMELGAVLFTSADIATEPNAYIYIYIYIYKWTKHDKCKST